MASRRSSLNRLDRDWRSSLVFIGWIGLCLSLLSYSTAWMMTKRHWSKVPRDSASTVGINKNSLYVGSIIVGQHSDKCWQRMFDNRTGTMWDLGSVNCETAISDLQMRNRRSAARVQVISNAFRRGDR